MVRPVRSEASSCGGLTYTTVARSALVTPPRVMP